MVDATISYLAAMPERPFFFLYDLPQARLGRTPRGADTDPQRSAARPPAVARNPKDEDRATPTIGARTRPPLAFPSPARLRICTSDSTP